MKAKIIRLFSWISMIIYFLTALAAVIMTFTENLKSASISTIIMCLLISTTGWYGRKFGYKDYKVTWFAKLSAIISLILGTVFLIITFIFTDYSDFIDSFVSVVLVIMILFFPLIVSSIAILSTKSNNSN